MPVQAKQSLPEWADPANASVFDTWQAPLRSLVKLVKVLGLDDPNAIMSVGMPMEAGANTGGLIDAVAAKFPRVAQAIKAFHGSPHDFEKFSMEKIGTGEGAQAYGHGLYFAENEGTARAYRSALAPDAFADGDPRNGIAKILAAKGEDAGLPMIRKAYANLGEQLEPAIEQARSTMKGRMYEVGINAHPDHFLDWDKPLSEQSAHVQDALTKLGVPIHPEVTAYQEPTGIWRVKAGKTYHGGFATQQEAEAKAFTLIKQSQQSGAQAYESSKLVPGPYNDRAAASAKLKEAGIPGIKYLDAGSRAGGQGSRNFVVFDDSLVDILKKYGIAAPVIEGLRQQAAKQNGAVDLTGVMQ